jgi:hypothetical protein
MDISIIAAMWVIPLGITGIQTGTFFKCEGCDRTKRTGFVDFITRLTSNVIFTSVAIILYGTQIIECQEKISIGGYSLAYIPYLLLVCIIFIAFAMLLTAVKQNATSTFIKGLLPIVLLFISLGLSLFTVLNVFKIN